VIPPVLRTARLAMRPLTRDDIAPLVPIFGNPEVTRYYAQPVPDHAAVAALVERRLARAVLPGMGSWALWRDDTLVGLANLWPSNEMAGELPEMGWLLGREHWGQGLATEAARAVIEHGLHGLGLPAIWALVHKENTPSLAVAKRLGLLEVGKATHYGGPHRVLVGLADHVTRVAEPADAVPAPASSA
jgi:RimJ/RimL family protein N-acetyltransferase